MDIRIHRNFAKRYVKLPSGIQERFKERRDIFAKNSFDPILQNHALKGKYQGYRSINITGDWRAVFQLNGSDAYFVEIGTHSYLYG